MDAAPRPAVPRRTGPALGGFFAVSRCVGWVAHAIEQYEAGYLLRPRARYQAPDIPGG